jgi:Polyketide cyclase / dehydrase and lipid transport
MPKFTLAPVGADDFRCSAGLFPFTVELNIDAAAFWAELNGPTPLSWCRPLRKVEWTSRPPHTAGSTRTGTLALTGTTLQERYFHWEQADGRYANAFSVTATNTPGLRRFAEHYEVVPTQTGCQFTWTFLVEPLIPAMTRFARPLVRSVLKQFITDTQRGFS